MSTLRSRQIWTTGLAMFSMFFGAGNIVFPLLVGTTAGDKVMMALVGLLITAVGVPFLGLLSMILFDGDYGKFFNRIGQVPGYLTVLFIMILIGPINAIPRCIALSYGTIRLYCPSISLLAFSIVSCLIIFMATARKSRIVDLLGAVLSPVLVLALITIIVKGVITHPQAPVVDMLPVRSFWFGLLKGYNTMDLLGTFFFSGVVLSSLRLHFPEENDTKVLAGYALQASVIGAGLLGAVYVGFAFVASFYGAQLSGLSHEVLLGTVASLVLGKLGGIVVSVAVALACLTTAITLASVVAEYLQKYFFFGALNYTSSLIITLIVSCAFSNLGFAQIVAMIEPILVVGYPALIALTIVNALYKLYGVHSVKIPVMSTALVSLLFYLYG